MQTPSRARPQVAVDGLVALQGHFAVGMFVALIRRQEHWEKNDENDQNNRSDGPAKGRCADVEVNPFLKGYGLNNTQQQQQNL